MFRQNDQNRRSFLRTASLLSLSLSLPGLSAKSQSTLDDPANALIEIRPGKGVTILVSVFTVPPENEEKLVELIEEGTLSIFSKQPGFISESVHRSIDAKRLVLYGQWESLEHIEAFRKKPEIGEYFQKIRALATAESVICNDIPFVHHI